jgi:hypothetical protein
MPTASRVIHSGLCRQANQPPEISTHFSNQGRHFRRLCTKVGIEEAFSQRAVNALRALTVGVLSLGPDYPPSTQPGSLVVTVVQR